MRRYNFRKRKSPSEAVNKFLEVKKNKIIEKELLENDDDDYVPGASASFGFFRSSFGRKKRNEKDNQDDVILYDSDEKESVSSDEKSSENNDLDVNDMEEEILSDGMEDVSEDQDWKLDTSLLTNSLTRDLKKSFPDMDEEELKKTVNHVLSTTGEDIIEEYSGAVPRDARWKIGLEKTKVEILEPILRYVRDHIELEEPTLDKILETPMSLEDRMKMVQKFDVYKNTEPYTEDYLILRTQLIENLNDHSRTNGIDIERLEKEERRILQSVPANTIVALKNRIIRLEADDTVKARLLELYNRLQGTPSDSTLYSALKEKLEWASSLPYSKIVLPDVVHGKNTIQEVNAYCVSVRKKLDEELYGMENIKDELIMILNDRITNPNTISTIALKGIQGSGKTAISSALAKAVGLPFERIALGGMEDVTALKGADSHWLGSAPSIILQFLKKMKIANGIVLFDEIDKLGNSEKGRQIQDALLHITDYTQNHEFADAFLTEFPHDLSKIWFIYALNDDKLINPILRDRLTILVVEPYTIKELTEIIRLHLLPKALDGVCIPREQISITPGGCSAILNLCSDEMKTTGVRSIQREVRSLVSRINLLRTNTLPDGTTGELRLKYTLPGFKLPLMIDEKVISRLLVKKPRDASLSYFM